MSPRASRHLAEHCRTAAPLHCELCTSQAEMQQLMNSDEGREASAKIMAAPRVTRVAGCSLGRLPPGVRRRERGGFAGLEMASAPPDLGYQIRPRPPGHQVAIVHATMLCPAGGGAAW